MLDSRCHLDTLILSKCLLTIWLVNTYELKYLSITLHDDCKEV